MDLLYKIPIHAKFEIEKWYHRWEYNNGNHFFRCDSILSEDNTIALGLSIYEQSDPSNGEPFKYSFIWYDKIDSKEVSDLYHPIHDMEADRVSIRMRHILSNINKEIKED